MQQIKILFLILFILINFSIPTFSYAEEQRNWEIRNYQTVRIDTDSNNDDDHTYLTRIAAVFYYKLSEELNVKLALQPFAETRYHWDAGEWKRTELGVETGFYLNKWAYIGESFQYAWLEDNKDTPEFETRLEITVPFMLNSEGYKVAVGFIEEYTYAVEEGEATRNEIALNLTLPIFKYLELLCGWRHIDRIGDYDSDQIELSAIFTF